MTEELQDTVSGKVAGEVEKTELEKAIDKRLLDAEKEGELDISNPDATPAKYSIFAEEKNKEVVALVEEFFEKLTNTEIPFAFIEVAHEVLKRRVQVFKARAKVFEDANRASNKAHLTPINQIELYATIEEAQESPNDLDGE